MDNNNQYNPVFQGHMPITIQPHSGFGVAMSPKPPMQMHNFGFPGLNYLSTVSHLLIKQKVELLELVTSFEGQNKYEIFNQLGKLVFTAKEHSGCLVRQCCGSVRPFEMIIRDTCGTDVIALNRPLRCESCCFPCCLQEIEVSSPPGTVVGSIKQNWSCRPSFDIKDAMGTSVLQIKGSCMTSSCCGDIVFKLFTMDGDEIGRISKKWTGFVKEAFTDADNFGIIFPIDLDVNMKATVLGATFLIDFMYFESSAKRHHH